MDDPTDCPDPAIPHLLPPAEMPPVRTQADLDRTWRALMGELGFSRPLLWLMFLDDDDRCTGLVTQVEDIPARPDPELLDGLLVLCARVVREGLGARAAFLRSRPGSRLVTEDDRAWARGLLRAARLAGVACAPVHLATDEAVLVLALDDLGDLGDPGNLGDLDLPDSA